MAEARKIARNSLVQFAGRGVTMTASLIALALLSQYLGPHRFGQYSLVIAFLTLVNVSDLGVATIAIRHLSTTDKDPDELMGNVLTIRTLLAFVSSALAITFAWAVDYPPDVRMAIAVASLSFPLTIFSGSYNAAFAANLRMEYAVLGNIAQTAVGLAAMIAVVEWGGGLVALVVAYDLGILANSVVCLHFARRFVRPSFHLDLRYTGQMLREALPLGLAVLIITAYGRIDILILKAFTDSPSVGYYAFAYRVVDIAFPLSFFFVGSVFPLLSSHHAAGARAAFRELYQRAHDVLSLAGMALVTLLFLFAPPIVDILGGGAYGASVTSMRVLSMAVALIWLSNLVDHGLIAVGKQNTLLWIACTGLVVNIGANLILIPIYGKEGAAAATVITEAAVLLPALFMMSRYLGEAPSFWVAGRLLPVAGVAGITVYGLKLPWATEAVLAVALFGLGVAATRVVSLSDLRHLLSRHTPPETAPAPAVVEVGSHQ